MHKNSFLANSVRFALIGGAAATAFTAPAAYSAEEDVERIEVTGSRIKRTDMEGASPVVVIDRSTIDNSGQLSLADVLNQSTFNSFGSLQPSSGSTGQSQATVNLRGLGSSRTLVLLNGRKMPGSPVLGGASADLNSIPFAAVERIEVLSDGASAVYGSDAIAGVVNIILRKDFNGVEVSARKASPSRDGGGDESSFSLVTGFSGEKSNITFSIEHDERDIIFQRDRWFTRATDDGSGHYAGTTGQSWYGRNILDMSTFEFNPMIKGTDCSPYGPDFKYHDDAPTYPDDDGCHFDYTAVAADAASTKRDAMFVDYNYEINDDLVFTVTALNTRNESFGRYAPAAGWFTFPIALAGTDTLTAVNEGDRGYYRFNNVGTARDTTQTSYMTDYTAGLKGLGDGYDWHVDYHYNRYDMKEWGQGYVHRPSVEQAIKDGWDPRDPDQAQYADLLAGMAANSNRQAGSVFKEVNAGVTIDSIFELPAGDVGVYVGGSYREESYFDQAEAQNEAKNIIGTAGGSASGERDAWALFTEIVVPVLDEVEVNLAARYDNYSDFGSSFVPKVGVKYQPTDDLILRASYGEGFRAPSLEDLYKAPQESASSAKDVVNCAAGGLSRPDCRSRQHTTYFIGRDDLEAEESKSLNFGIVYNVTDNVDITLDYYDIEVDNQVASLSTQDVFDLENLGLLGDPKDPSDNPSQYAGAAVDRGDTTTGRSLLVTAPMANVDGFDTSGIDFKLNALFELGDAGDLRTRFEWSEVLEYNSPDIIGFSRVDKIGRAGLPERKINVAFTWSLDNHAVNLNVNHTASTYEETTTDATGTIFTPVGSLDSYTITNLNYTYNTPWDLDLTVGVNNLTDEDPVLDEDLGYDDTLYSRVGRVYFAGLKYKF
jgi:iron complex outermembrane receptor protein